MMARRVLCVRRLRKPEGIFARVMPDSIARSPCKSRLRGPIWMCDGHTLVQETLIMRADPSMDPNAELRNFEPLRVVLAIGSLLLAVLMSLH